MLQNIPFDKIIDKPLYAAQPIKVYKLPGLNNTVIHTVPANGFIGKIFSWNTVAGKTWFSFRRDNGDYYYVYPQKDTVDWQRLERDLINAGELPAETATNGGTSALMVGGILFGFGVAMTAQRPAVRILGGSLAALLAGKLIVDKVSSIDLNPFD